MVNLAMRGTDTSKWLLDHSSIQSVNSECRHHAWARKDEGHGASLSVTKPVDPIIGGLQEQPARKPIQLASR